MSAAEIEFRPDKQGKLDYFRGPYRLPQRERLKFFQPLFPKLVGQEIKLCHDCVFTRQGYISISYDPNTPEMESFKLLTKFDRKSRTCVFSDGTRLQIPPYIRVTYVGGGVQLPK